MPRLNIERQNELEPKRLEYACQQIRSLGFFVEKVNETTLEFIFKGSKIKVYPFSGWCSGKTIKDCRGIHNLLAQLK